MIARKFHFWELSKTTIPASLSATLAVAMVRVGIAGVAGRGGAAES